MVIKTQKFVRKPFFVESVEVTAENMEDVAEWCRGQIRKSAGTGKKGARAQTYIKVHVKRALTPRHTMAYVGDRVVMATDENIRGFKVYTPNAFEATFDQVVEGMIETLERMGERAKEEDRMEEEGLFPEELFSHGTR